MSGAEDDDDDDLPMDPKIYMSGLLTALEEALPGCRIGLLVQVTADVAPQEPEIWIDNFRDPVLVQRKLRETAALIALKEAEEAGNG